MDFYSIKEEELLRQLKSSKEGLTEEEAAGRGLIFHIEIFHFFIKIRSWYF